MRRAVGCWCITRPYHRGTHTQKQEVIITYLQPHTAPVVQKVITQHPINHVAQTLIMNSSQ